MSSFKEEAIQLIKIDKDITITEEGKNFLTSIKEDKVINIFFI